MKTLNSIFLLVISMQVLAQDPVGVATLPSVDKAGFYRIHLSPEIVSYLTPEFGNVRIVDQDGIEVPYLLDEERPSFSTTSFREYKMDKKLTPACCTELVVYNPERKDITNFSLEIKNADVYKRADLLGSDDLKEWYALREDFIIQPVTSASETSEVRIMDFPLSNYGYYKLVINDSASAPLNFVKSGSYEMTSGGGRYSEVPAINLSVEQKKIEKQTWVTIASDTTVLVDKLILGVSGPMLYHRDAAIYARRWYPDKKGKLIESLEYIGGMTLASRQEASVRIGSVRVKELVIKINNDDNPPLTIESAKLLQLNRYLVALLSPGKAYKIQVGEESQQPPVYDLAFFRDSIPASPPQLSTSDLVVRAAATPKSFTLFTNRNIIWVAIVLVVAVLGYMSRKLIKEAGERQH